MSARPSYDSLEAWLLAAGRLRPDAEQQIRGAAAAGRSPSLRVLLAELDALRKDTRRALAIIAQHHAVGQHAGSPCTDCGEEGPCVYAAWWAEAAASVGGVRE